MEQEISNTKQKFVYLKAFDLLSDIEKDIKTVKKSIFDLQISVLGKINKAENGEAIVKKENTQKHWEKTLGDSGFGKLSSPEIGVFYVAGSLTDLFLYEIEGKPLAEMSTGIYGILRGLGFDQNTVDVFLKDLLTGHYLLILRGENDQLKVVQELLEV